MGGGSHFVAMTTPISLQPWWWQIFILIQLWSQFFQMFVYGNVVYAQTWYWPWKTVSSHLLLPGRPMLLQYGPHFFSTLSGKFGQLERFFWANGLPPPLAKNFPYAYENISLTQDSNLLLIHNRQFEPLRDRRLEKLWGGRGIFEPQEFIFVIKFLACAQTKLNSG